MIFNKVFNKAPQKRTKNPVIANEAFRYRNGGGRPVGMAMYETWLQQISTLRNVISTTAELASSAHIKFYKEDSKGKRGIFNNPKMFDKDDPSLTFRERVQMFESTLINETLKITGNQSQAAKALKMDRTSLRRIIERELA